MPFQSEKQRRYLWANEPEIARDWTDTYGSRIRRDNGGSMQGGVQNFLGQQPMVNAPKYWQSAPDHEMTELAYITPQERDVLVDMDMYGTMRGGPNRGPSGIMSLNGWGSSDPSQNRAGADITAAMDVDPGGAGAAGWADTSTAHMTGATGMSPAKLKQLSERKGGDTVLSSGMRDYFGMPKINQRSGWQKFNPFSLIGGAFGNIGKGIGFLMGSRGKDLAGKMRGGINQATGKYYTQAEYEQNRRARINQTRISNILGRKAPITDMTIQNLKNLGYTGDMPDVGRSPEMMNMNKLGLYTDRVSEPIGPGERIGQYWRDDQGITGLDAYEDFTGDVASSKDMANYLTNREQFPAYEEFLPNEVAETERDFPRDEEIAEERFVGLEHMSTYDKVEYNALKKNKALGIKLTPEKEKRLKELQKKRDAPSEEGTAIV